MSKTQVDPKLFVAAVRKLAADNPEFVYEPVTVTDVLGRPVDRCVYVNDEGAGSCIVGQALIACGVPADELRRYDAMGTAASIVVQDHSGNDTVAGWARAVQSKQDRHEQWSYAVTYGDRTHPEIAAL